MYSPPHAVGRSAPAGEKRGCSPPHAAGRSARSAPGGEEGEWYSPPHAVGRSARAARRVGRRERGIRLPTQWGGRRAQRAGWGERSVVFASPRSGEVGARSAPGGEEGAWYSPPHAVGRSARAARRVGRKEFGIRLPTQWGGRLAQRAGWGERSVVFASPRSGEVGARSAPGGEKRVWDQPSFNRSMSRRSRPKWLRSK